MAEGVGLDFRACLLTQVQALSLPQTLLSEHRASLSLISPTIVVIVIMILVRVTVIVISNNSSNNGNNSNNSHNSNNSNNSNSHSTGSIATCILLVAVRLQLQRVWGARARARQLRGRFFQKQLGG